ncbi:MAG: hypothetical protein ACPLPR_05835 [Bacillota bacterium]
MRDPKARTVLLLRELAALGRDKQIVLVLDNAIVVGKVSASHGHTNTPAQSLKDAFDGLGGVKVVAQGEENFEEAVVVYDAKLYPLSRGPMVEAEVLVIFPETVRAVAVGVARAVQE